MAVQSVDPNAKQPKTGTAPYGGLSGNAPKAADFSDTQSNVGDNKTGKKANLNPAQPSLAQTETDGTNNPQITNLGVDVGAVPAPTYSSPSIHDLAVDTVKERGGPNAESLPDFKDQVKDVEDQMRNTISRTQGTK